MKTHTTIKSIRNNYNKVFRCGYCDLYYIFHYTDPNFYNSGVYGWNCDIYTDPVRDIAITTGYRNMAGSRIPSEFIHKYTAKAKIILERWDKSKTFQDVLAELDENKEAFLQELCNI